MKISKATIEILKNFASNNQNILIKEGNTLTTRSTAKNIFGSAVVDTSFPQQIGIYNLNSFLGVISLFSDPEIDFDDKSMIISQGKNRVVYMQAAPEVLNYPDKSVVMPKADATFTLSEENLKSVLKAGGILASTDLKISGDGEVITLTALDPKNSSANTFSVEVGETDRQFEAFIKLENLRMPSGNYTVNLSEKKIAQFTNTAMDYNLYVANEKNTAWK
jgi:hypothetical protein